MSDDEITITPEMIEAGRSALDDHHVVDLVREGIGLGNLDPGILSRDRQLRMIATDVYRAMRALEPSQ